MLSGVERVLYLALYPIKNWVAKRRVIYFFLKKILPKLTLPVPLGVFCKCSIKKIAAMKKSRLEFLKKLDEQN